MHTVLSSSILPLATSILVAAFTVLLARQWLRRRKVHQAWWTAGFAMYSAAALAEFAADAAGGWNPLLFRFYVMFSATLVAVLAQGSVALLARRPVWSRAYLAYNALCAAALLYGVVTTPLIPEELAKAAVSSYAPLGGTALTYPRVVSLALTIPAALILFGGALVSAWRFLRKREYAYRVWANALIALATLVISSGGGLAKAGNTTAFYVIEMAAAALFLAGFLMAGTLGKGAEAAKAAGAARRETARQAR